MPHDDLVVHRDCWKLEVAPEKHLDFLILEDDICYGTEAKG